MILLHDNALSILTVQYCLVAVGMPFLFADSAPTFCFVGIDLCVKTSWSRADYLHISHYSYAMRHDATRAAHSYTTMSCSDCPVVWWVWSDKQQNPSMTYDIRHMIYATEVWASHAAPAGKYSCAYIYIYIYICTYITIHLSLSIYIYIHIQYIYIYTHTCFVSLSLYIYIYTQIYTIISANIRVPASHVRPGGRLGEPGCAQTAWRIEMLIAISIVILLVVVCVYTYIYIYIHNILHLI